MKRAQVVRSAAVCCALYLTGGVSQTAPGPAPLRVAGAAVAEGHAGLTPMVFQFATPSVAPPPGLFPLRLRWTTGGGSASAGTDYQSASGEITLTWPPPFPTVSVQVRGDTEVEPDETVGVRFESLAAPTPSPLVLYGEGVILNDDGPNLPPARPLLVPVDARVQEPRVGTVTASLAVRLLRPTAANLTNPAPVSVEFLVSGGTASLGTDYTGPTHGVLSFAPNEAVKLIPFQILADNIIEGLETIRVSFRNPVGAQLSRTGAELGILDAPISPLPGGVVLVPCRPFVAEGELARVLARRVGDSSAALSVGYRTEDATARAGDDYVATQGMLTWTAGDATFRVIEVATLEDNLDESDERFWVGLLPTPPVANTGPARVPVIIRDDDGVFVDDLEELCATPTDS